jgi:uncharacterized membrane protein
MSRAWRRLRAAPFWVGPFLLPGAAAYYLYRFYDTLPARFPIHWDHGGRPDQWADKSMQGVFYGPVIGALVMVFTACAEALIFAAHRTSPVQPDEAEAARLAAQRRRVGWLNWGLCVVFGALSILPGLAPEDFLLPGWVMATAAFLVVVVALFTTLKIKDSPLWFHSASFRTAPRWGSSPGV